MGRGRKDQDLSTELRVGEKKGVNEVDVVLPGVYIGTHRGSGVKIRDKGRTG